VHRKGRYFYTQARRQEKTIVYWKQGEGGSERVLFDPNTWSPDGTLGLGGWWPSRDGKSVAYAVKQHNSDETITYVIDPETGTQLSDALAGTKYSGTSWTPDGEGFYYTWVPPVGGEVTIADRPGFAELRFHALGTEQAADPTVYPATRNPRWFVAAASPRMATGCSSRSPRLDLVGHLLQGRAG
jgi:prolyl oligopeptidase